MKKLIKKIIQFILLLFLVGFLIDLVIKNPMNNKLLEYQITKLDKAKNIDIALIGDSSLGNSIQAKFFDKNTYNFALTGDYNLINNYRMLEKIIKSNPELRKVYIMQTFDVYERDNSNMLNINLEQENLFLRIFVKIKSLKYYLTVKPFDNSRINYELDYMSQSENIYDFKNKKRVLTKNISSDNKSSILSIKKLCEKNNIDYYFLFGPSILLEKNEYYIQLIDFFKTNQIQFKKDYFVLNEQNIGDAIDHVSSLYKEESTKFYYDLVNRTD